MRKLAAGWARMASAGRSAQAPREDMSIARLLALAFPERIGKARGAPGQFLLANGRGANVDATHPLARSPFLVAAELSGSAASTRILLAAAADEADILAAAGKRIRDRDEIEFDQGAGALRSRRVRRLDAIVLASEPRAVMPSEDTARLLADGIAQARTEPPAVEQGANPAARPCRFLARGRRGRMAGPDRCGARRDGHGVAGALPRRQDEAVRDRRR